jgi:23S rRNA maturation-related 3'-5' exoribonuclease YhaM
MKTMVEELEPGQWITTVFVVKSALKRKSKNNQEYFVFEFCDRTGSVKGYLWNALETGSSVKPGCYVKVRGYIKTFNDTNILQIKKMWLASKTEITPSDFSVLLEPVSQEEFQKIKEQLYPERGDDFLGAGEK